MSRMCIESGLRASTRNAHSRKRILMCITQSTSIGGLNPDWFVDCKGPSKRRALLSLWRDECIQGQLEDAV